MRRKIAIAMVLVLGANVATVAAGGAARAGSPPGLVDEQGVSLLLERLAPTDRDLPAPEDHGSSVGHVSNVEQKNDLVLPVDEEPWLHSAHLRAANPAPKAAFGHDVDITDDAMVVGAPGEGAAYVFERAEDGSWAQAARLTIPGVGSWARFGEAVAIDGEWAAVGARWAEAVYLFERSSAAWSLAQQLGPSPSDEFTAFGHAVALDGHRLAVGTPDTEDGSGSRAGSVHVFELAGPSWTETAVLTTSFAGSARLGWAVDVHGDTIVAGAMGAASIAIFEQGTGGGWTDVARFATSTPWDGFGRAVAVGGDTVAVGALSHSTDVESGGVYVYVRSEGAWSQAALIVPSDAAPLDGRTWFGKAVSLDNSGNRLLVGAPLEDHSPELPLDDSGAPDDVCRANGGLATCQHPGAAYLFEQGPDGWDQASKLTGLDAPPGQPNQFGKTDRFGSALAIDATGSTIIAGAPNDDSVPLDEAGSAYVFAPLRGVLPS